MNRSFDTRFFFLYRFSDTHKNICTGNTFFFFFLLLANINTFFSSSFASTAFALAARRSRSRARDRGRDCFPPRAYMVHRRSLVSHGAHHAPGLSRASRLFRNFARKKKRKKERNPTIFFFVFSRCFFSFF